MLCNYINILCCPFLKPVLRYGPYYVDRFEKKFMQISHFLEIMKEKIKNSVLLDLDKCI